MVHNAYFNACSRGVDVFCVEKSWLQDSRSPRTESSSVPKDALEADLWWSDRPDNPISSGALLGGCASSLSFPKMDDQLATGDKVDASESITSPAMASPVAFTSRVRVSLGRREGGRDSSCDAILSKRSR